MCKYAIIGAAVVFISLYVGYFPFCTQEIITATVKKTERVIHKESSKYLVFTDNEVLENTDCLILLKWNSSDIYGGLEVGKTYRFRVYGWRWRFMSWYRNIISVEKVN